MKIRQKHLKQQVRITEDGEQDGEYMEKFSMIEMMMGI